MKPSRKTAEAPETADAESSTGGVTAVTRALRVLECFGMDDPQLTLAEMSRRTGMHKTTTLRLARTLAAEHYLVQKEDGSWRLGRAAGWLGACYQAVFDVHEVVEPVRKFHVEMKINPSVDLRGGPAQAVTSAAPEK